MRHVLFSIMLVLSSILPGSLAVAQVLQPGVGAGDTTTEGLGGLTTEGLNANVGTDGSAFPGADGVTEFVGATPEGEFVGGGREAVTETNVNRLFRAITGGDVPTGGTRETTGNPRRVPVSLRLGFTPPTPRQATALAGTEQVALKRYLRTRPELLAVAVTMDDAGLVTLSGTVPDTSTRRLAANLVRLQPGVRRIRNEVVVEALPATNE